MALLNAVVLESKAMKNGKNKVRISVAHNGQTRYIVTDIILDSNKEFKNGQVVRRPDATILNIKIRNLLQRYQSALDELEYTNGLTAPELVYLLENANNYKHRTLKSIFEEYISNSRAKSNSISSFQYSWKSIEAYLGDKILAEHINHSHVLGLDKYLRERRKLKSSSMRNILVLLASLLKYAKRCGYIQFRVDPFWGYHYPQSTVRESWLTVEEVRRIRDVKSDRKCISLCRDLFMLSYCLGGINMADLVNINFNENADVLKYERKKTENRAKANRHVEFIIPEEAKEILARRKRKDGFLDISSFQRKSLCKEFFSRNMPELAKEAGLKKLIYYSARKSFSQHAFNLGVSTAVIDYILGHKVDKGGTSLYSYIRVTPEMATRAVREVLDNLK